MPRKEKPALLPLDERCALVEKMLAENPGMTQAFALGEHEVLKMAYWRWRRRKTRDAKKARGAA